MIIMPDMNNKCKRCPYHLGLIKTLVNPCIKCRMEKRKTPPFPTPIFKKNKGKKAPDQ
jgi:hypothetical protein